MEINWVDMTLLVLLVSMIVVGSKKGLIRELMAFFVFVAATWRFLPRTPLYGRLVMAGTQQTAEGYVAQTAEDVEAGLGQRGVTTSMLRPTGWGRFGGSKFQIVSRGAFIPKNVPVEIVEVEGNRYVVERREDTE